MHLQIWNIIMKVFYFKATTSLKFLINYWIGDKENTLWMSTFEEKYISDKYP